MRAQSEDDFDRMARAAKLLAVAAAWNELGLWERLANSAGPVELADLPGDTRALTMSAAVLAHAGLLDGGGGRWTLSKAGRTLFAAGALPRGFHLDWLGDLTRMPAVLRHGGPVPGPDGRPRVTSGGVRPDDREASKAFLDMLYRRSHDSAEASAAWLAARLPAGARVLDLGGGHGRYCEAFRARGLRPTLFDFPLVIELARERHGETLAYQAGDFHHDELGGPWDAVFLSNILHGETAVANATLVAKVQRALAPGGHAVFKDMFIDDHGREPENAVFFGLTMLFYTAGGASHTVADVAGWCSDAGLAAPEVIGIDTFSLLFAQKRA